MAERYNRLRDFALLLRNIESFTAGQARIVSYEEDALRNIDVELCPSDGPYKGGTFFFRVSFINTLRPRQNGRHFPDDIFKRIFLNENVRISIKISPKFVPKGPISINPALVQIMAWCRSGGKPLSEPMMVSLLTHICVTRPQCVNNQQWCARTSVPEPGI